MTQDEKDALFKKMCERIQDDVRAALYQTYCAGNPLYGPLLRHQSQAVSAAAQLVYGPEVK